jgi:hypothetical protein
MSDDYNDEHNCYERPTDLALHIALVIWKKRWVPTSVSPNELGCAIDGAINEFGDKTIRELHGPEAEAQP